MKPIRVALIGCGYIAEKHIRAINELGSALQLAALCDLNRERMDILINKIKESNDYPNLSLYTDFERCLNQEDIDLVVIATSTDSHIPLALRALKSGKHVLVEKPLALSIGEARHAAQIAKKHGRVMAVCLQTRYLSQIQAMKKAVDQGYFGQLMHGVVSVRWNRNDEYFRSSPWRNSWAKGGGTLINQCIHYIDLLQWLMGPVVSVYGQAGTLTKPIQVEHVGLALLTFASGAIGIVEGSTCIYPKNLTTSISLFGEKGTVTLEGERLNSYKHWSFSGGGPINQADLKIDEISHTPMYKEIIHAILTGSTPLVSVENSLHSLEIVLAIYKSISERRPIELPLNEFKIVNMVKED